MVEFIETNTRRSFELSDVSKEALSQFPVPQDAIEKIVKGKFSEDHPFIKKYKALADFNYPRKFSIAYALANDGRFQQMRQLLDNFITPKDSNKPENKELANDLRALFIERGYLSDRKEAKQLREFVEEVGMGETLDSQQFRKLITVFGASNAADILYRYKPDFKGVPIEKVNSILADYLGDFLITKQEFNPDDVKEGAKYLSDATLREGLVEVIKNSFIERYILTKKTGRQIVDKNIVQEFVDDLRVKFQSFSTPDLETVAGEIEAYYQDVFGGFEKPLNIVDKIGDGRSFPDFGQAINIKEVKDKKRVLIADKMGLGKSASAILAKESLGVKTALVVAPSDVIATWQRYLSDKKDENGKPEGYFKTGQAPRVLTLDDPRSLDNVDASSYDYVLISQERLNDKYTSFLTNVEFGMVIVDEIHKLKNISEGVRANNLLKITRDIELEDKYLVMLSGTPIPNKVEDIAMILKLLYPAKFGEIENKDMVRQILYGDTINLRSLLMPRMQIKDLGETIDMPKLKSRTEYIDLSRGEADIYEALLEEDEITATAKLQILRQFLLNPEIIKLTPGIESSKVNAVGNKLREIFTEKNKVVMFVNGYIEGVLRGQKHIIDKLGIPNGVEVLVVEGNVSSKRREEIQRLFKESTGKVLAIFSGETVDVGVDYSAGDVVIHYNEAWSVYKKEQQTYRVYRPGVGQDIEELTFITRNTIEEGIQQYIEAKHKAIQKLLYGIPIKDLERELLEKTSVGVDVDELEVNPELAEYYLSSWDRMMDMFKATREIGQKDFVKFLEKNGQLYAECYLDLGSRSYQANASRVSATLIDRLITENNQSPKEVSIVDIASGPEVLRKHILEQYQDKVISLDLNSHHFQGEGGSRVVGSFGKLPFADNSVDYANLALALHYTKLILGQDDYERLEVLSEISRILKIGGVALINNIYSVGFKNEDGFAKVVERLGLRIREDYSGIAKFADNYKSKVYVLEKVEDNEALASLRLWFSAKGDKQQSISEIITDLDLTEEDIRGMKFGRNKLRLKNSRRMLVEFSIGDNTFLTRLNSSDKSILEEEQEALTQGEALKTIYGNIESIPREEIVNNSFIRFYNGKRFVLFKRLSSGEGTVIVR